MVLPSFVSIVAAVVVALLSSASLVALRKRSFALLASRNHNDVLFSVTPVQREALFFGEFTEIFEDETNEIRAMFDKEGYVIIRGLVDDAMMDRLDAAANVFLQEEGQTNPPTFSALKFNPIYLSPPRNATANAPSDLDAFREVALTSPIPSFIARVLLDLPPDKTLRVLKDVFLAKGREENYCGWHVDDSSFWPACAHSTSELPGVNAWIAMDDIPPKFGGGLAVARKSHKADWRQEAYETIGSTQTFPHGGYKTLAEIFSNAKATTCSMAQAAPDLDSRIDRTRHVFDFQKGDVLIHTRWLFHRSVPLTKAGIKHFGKLEPVIKRYSIRYEVGDARLLGGFTMEPSVVLKPENAMKTLDEVSANGAAWYPKCWPNVDANEMSHLHEIVDEKLPAFEPLKQELFRELLPYL